MIFENAFDTLPKRSFHQVSSLLQNGDLLFCSGSGLISRLIKKATKSEFSHVAILLCLSMTKQWVVVESVESIGVRCVTLLEGYIKNYQNTQKGYAGKILFARHQRMVENSKFIENLYARAFRLMGDQYSREDVFHIASRIMLNKIGVHKSGEVRENNRYICSEYVYACLKAAKIELPYDPLGFIAPADIAHSPELSPLCQLEVTD